MPKVGPDAPIEDRINYVLYNELTPGLRLTSVVSLVEVTPEAEAILQFGGGCQGCSAVDLAFKGQCGDHAAGTGTRIKFG